MDLEHTGRGVKRPIEDVEAEEQRVSVPSHLVISLPKKRAKAETSVTELLSDLSITSDGAWSEHKKDKLRQLFELTGSMDGGTTG